MIKRLFFGLFVFALAICFCSCESSASGVPGEEIPFDDFNIALNGVLTDSLSAYVTKVENDFVIRSGIVDELSFNKNGTFGKLGVNLRSSTPTITSLFSSYRDYSSHFMNFNLVSVDEVNKRVKGSVSGYIYHDPLDLGSEQKYIEINFDYPYIEIFPTLKGLENRCKIGDSEWQRTNKYFTKSGVGNNNITQHDIDDSEYKIMVNYNLLSIGKGEFDYTFSDVTNNVQLAKYDLSTGTYVHYNCTGKMTINQYESLNGTTTPGFFNFILSGTYEFTATNPSNSNDVIHVTDGTFKLLYKNF